MGQNPKNSKTKDKVISITYEEIGLFPRSFSRVFDRFFKQIFSDVENLVIQEYRFYRYLFLTTIQTIFILLFVPLVINFMAKTYLIRPITEYFWNTKQTEIFLNSYEQKRAFLELQDFEEKLYFDSLLISNNLYFSPRRESEAPPPSGGGMKQRSLPPESKVKPSSLSTESLTIQPSASSLISRTTKPSNRYMPIISFVDPRKASSGLSPLLPTGEEASPKKRLGDRGDSNIESNQHSFRERRPILDSVAARKGQQKLGIQIDSFNNLSRNRAEVSLTRFSSKENPLVMEKDAHFGFEDKRFQLKQQEKKQATDSTEKSENINPSRGFVKSNNLMNSNFWFNDSDLLGGQPRTKSDKLDGTSQNSKPSVSDAISYKRSSQLNGSISERVYGSSPEFQKPQGINLFAQKTEKGLLKSNIRSSDSQDNNSSPESNIYLLQERLQEKTFELAIRYNNHSIESITNFFADFFSLISLLYLLISLEIQINITKSFLLEVFFGLDDSKKSLLILIMTDLLVGYHSSNLWELFFQFIFNHYGIPESQTGIFLLVATLPVLLDVLFKYLIFRHLNRASPATVATYHAIIE